jgi:WD40 repeat protein
VFVNGLHGLCAFSPDGSWVATVDDDWTIRVWDPDTAQQLARIPARQAERFAPGPCAGANCMVTLAEDGLLRVRDRRAFMRGELPGHGVGPVTRAFLAGRMELVAEDKSGLHVWDLQSGRRLYDLPGEHGAAPLEPSRRFPDGAIVTLGQDGQVRFREPPSGRQRAALDGASAGISAAGHRVQAKHPAGQWVAITDDRGTLTVGIQKAGEVRLVSGGTGDEVTACAASPNGSLLATVRESGVLTVWDTTTWQQMATADTEGTLAGVAWSPAGDRIYAVGGSGALCYDIAAACHASDQEIRGDRRD